MLNPASTGIFTGNHRAFINYKNQWRMTGLSGATYTTALFSYDASIFKKKFSAGYLGAGVNAYKDAAGDLKMGTTQINFSLSGIVFINDNQLLSGGLQGGFAQKSVKADAMQWDNQYDATSGTFNPALPSHDIADVPPYNYGDFSAGLLWNYSADETSLMGNDQLKTTLGVSVQHINRPKQKFNPNNSNEKLYSKFIVHGVTQIGIGNTNYDLVPAAIFYKQGESNELNIGTMIRWTIQEESKYTGHFKETALSLGAQYRVKDALIPVVLLEYTCYAVGVSYDVNISSLKQGTRGNGGIEISLRYINPNPFHAGRSNSVRFL